MNQGDTENRQEPDNSVFDQFQYRNPEIRRRQLRILRLSATGIGVITVLGIIAVLSPLGARFIMNITEAIAGDLEQPTATATLDISSITASSPTPPPTATTLFGGQTYAAEIATVDAEEKATLAAERTPEPGETPQESAIFFTPEPTIPPLDSPTPLPTRGAVDFASEGGGDLPTLAAQLDPRCADQPTREEYVYCIVRLAEEGEIDP
ncbi:MAG: hypothetical protein AAGD96_26330 [Chloroflexota bacterium]